jgi:diacylglycerol kinase
MQLITHTLRRFKFALSGITFAVRNDHSFKTQVAIGVPVVVLVAYFATPLSQFEWVLLLGSYLLVLITELQNTAFEAALDHLHPELHDNIGRSKDMAAGAVFLSGLIFLGAIILVVCF